MEHTSSILEKITKIEVQHLLVLYIVNIKDDYKKQLVFYKLNSAKHMKKHIINKYLLSGTEVYVNKVLGFYDNEDSIHCLNGFKYTLSSIEKNENDYQQNNFVELLSKFGL